MKALICVLVLSLSLAGCASSGKDINAGTQASSDDLFMLSVEAQRAYTQSRWIDAVRLYQQIVERAPTDSIAWFALANTYAQQGAFERAVYAYEQSLNYNPEQPKAWFNLSTAYLLNAQLAMQKSQQRMRASDPARTLVDRRMQVMQYLLHERFEEAIVVGQTPG